MISVLLWFIPFAGYLVFPFRIFVTFIHEGSHALAALMTGNHVLSLSVAIDGSGLTQTTQSGLFSDVLVSSAGYLGSTLFGALLLLLIRIRVPVRLILLSSGLMIGGLTFLFGLTSSFTLVSGIAITIALFFAARLTTVRMATFLASFLAVQCVLNAILDLKTVLYNSTPFGYGVQTDAANLAYVTGIPSLVWVVVWIGISLALLAVTLRAYAVYSFKPRSSPLSFEDHDSMPV
ncbi:MAG: M50 family metallopeptidase [Pyrinomonadaceae bacterium]